MMPMTKKERAELDAAYLLGALRWTAPVAPDVLPPTDTGHITEAWAYNAYYKTVERGWSTSLSHGDGPAPKPEEPFRRGSHGSRAMYSTRLKAFAAMRYELEMEAARKLAAVDKLIREEQQKEASLATPA